VRLGLRVARTGAWAADPQLWQLGGGAMVGAVQARGCGGWVLCLRPPLSLAAMAVAACDWPGQYCRWPAAVSRATLWVA
jgi:hypothetical protein